MEAQGSVGSIARSDAIAVPPDIFPKDLGRKAIPFFLLGIAAYVALFFFADARDTWKHIDHVSGARVFLCFALSFASLLVRAVRWQFFVRLIGVTTPFADALLVFFVGIAMSVTPGKVGELVKSLLLKERWEVPAARSAPLVVAERLTDVVAVLLLGGGGLLGVPGAATAGAVTVLFAAGLLVLYVSQPAALFIVRQLSRIPFVARRHDKLMAMHASLEQASRPGPTAVAMALALLAWGLQSSCVWIIAGAFDGSGISFAGGLVAYCAPLLAGALALLPGGLGATEASMTGVLLALGGPGLTKSVAVAVTLLSRIVAFWFAVALGFAALVTWRIRRKRAITV